MAHYFYPTTLVTWNFDANGYYSTPILTGSNLVTNGNMESWGTLTNMTTWTEILAGTSTINRESSVVQAGTYSCRFDVDAGNNVPKISSALSGTHGRWIRFDYYWNVNTGSATVGFIPSSANLLSAGDARTIVPGWSADFDTGFIIGSSAFSPLFQPVSAASKSVYIDSVTGLYLDNTSLIALCSGQGTTETVQVKIKTLKTGTHAGVYGWVDSTSKNNYIAAFHDGVNIRLIKYVAGTATLLVNELGSFVSNASLEIRRPSGNNFEVWYNGAKVGLTQTISDASVISNTNAGMLSTYSGNRISEFKIGSDTILSFVGFYNDYSKDTGFTILTRNGNLISVTQESKLTPFVHTGWAVDSNGLLGGTSLLLTQTILVGQTNTITAGMNTYTPASDMGVISNADSTTPTNYLRAYYNGTQFKLDKIVGGVTTNLITSAGSFVANALIEINRTALTTFQLKYNGVQIGTNQTVSDVAIWFGNRYGLYSTNAANKFNNIIVNGQNLPFHLS